MLTSLLDQISARTAFFPPSPPKYTLERHGDGKQELYLKPAQPNIKKCPNAEAAMVPIPSTSKTNSQQQQSIVAVFVRAPTPSRFTLLHSHGNAVDLGDMLPYYEQLSKFIQINIIGYDYRGYGQSDGAPAMSFSFQDISAVLNWAQTTHGIAPEDVVLYGQSVGSGPTSWLAARTTNLRGVVLHSGLMSGLRVLRPSIARWPGWLDVFPNFKYISKVKSPTLIIHGTEDAVVGVDHGRQLHALCKAPSQPLWAEGCGHDDVEGHPEFIPTLRRFLKECYGDEYNARYRLQ